MKLLDLKNGISEEWDKNGYHVFSYDRNLIRENTLKSPEWVHFGAGNIFRAFPAVLLDKLLESNDARTGIIAAEGFDDEILDKAYKPYDCLSLSVILKADGTIEKNVTGSVVDTVAAYDGAAESEFIRLFKIFTADSLKICSFTITEKGYKVNHVSDDDINFMKNFTSEFYRCRQENSELLLKLPSHLMGKIAALLYARFLSGEYPLTLLSFDNCSHNGDKLKDGVMAFAGAWQANGIVPDGFIDYLNDSSRISFPWSMIDKITPRPDPAVADMLAKDGFEDTSVIVTTKHSYTAPFVNSEETGYLVIEDTFPAGRPPLENAGVYFTNKMTVDCVEKMKVCTCLNPLHTALAIFGCLLSFKTIHEEMDDGTLREFVTRMAYEEGMPVVTDPGILSPKAFIDTVLTKRLPNVFMPDTPMRIATDTSQKLSIRFGETIKAYLERNMSISQLSFIPMVLAGYIRYLSGINDAGQPFEKSPDPLMGELEQMVRGISFQAVTDKKALDIILHRADIFGVDLVEAGLSDIVIKDFNELNAGVGAVRKTLDELVKQ